LRRLDLRSGRRLQTDTLRLPLRDKKGEVGLIVSCNGELSHEPAYDTDYPRGRQRLRAGVFRYRRRDSAIQLHPELALNEMAGSNPAMTRERRKYDEPTSYDASAAALLLSAEISPLIPWVLRIEPNSDRRVASSLIVPLR
jgi:hypothetical protein